jgi:undecaprenyl-diphosphatase
VLICTVIFTLLISTQVLIIPSSKNIPEKMCLTNRLYRWDKVGADIQNILDTVKDTGSGDYFVLTNNYRTANQLTFHIPSHPKVYCINSDIDQYDFWQKDLISLNTKNAIFVTENRFYVHPGEIYPFKEFKELSSIDIYSRNKIARKFHLFICKYFMPDKVNADMTKSPDQTNIIKTLKQYDELILLKTNNISGSSKILDIVMVGFTMLGNGAVAISLVGVVLWFVNRKRFIKDFMIFLAIIITGGILIQTLKSLYDQPRPLKVLTNIRILLSPLKERGFPSGHTYAIFSAIVYLADKLKGMLRNYTWLLYPVAICGGLSRVYVGAHYLSDVIAGAVIGTIFTLFCIYLIRTISYQK